MNWLFTSRPVLTGKGIAVIRILIGAFLAYHGWEVFDRDTMNGYLEWDVFKGSNGEWMVYAGKVAELLGGILLILGLFTRIASILLMTTMMYICFIIGSGRVWYEDQHPFLFELFGIIFIITGPGNWAVDNLIGRKGSGSYSKQSF